MLAYYLEFVPIGMAVALVLGVVAAAILVKLSRNG
jgi:F0F1-type ATP synthase assembly protein I